LRGRRECCTERRKGRMPVKPTEKEEEYFARKEFERRQKLEEQKQRALSEEERRKLQELHRMKCPKCGMELIEIDYRGIRVDRCSACLGMWLDAGEGEALIKLGKPILDKLFDAFRK
jgi:hypothetical protein